MRTWGHHFRNLLLIFSVISTMLAVQTLRATAQTGAAQFGIVLGGSGMDRIYSLVRGPSGEFYVGGETSSTDLPVSAGALDQTSAGGEGFVARFSAAGTLEWLTYLGGSGPDAVYDLALGDSALYAVGATSSTDFPGARPVNGEKDGFAAAISLDGSALYYSTLLGGSDQESAYAVTVENNQAVITGISYSTDFSTSTYFGAGDAFVTRLNASGEPAFIQLFGGRAVDAGFDVAVQNGDIWVAGQTFSFNFPARGLKGLQDGFVMRLDSGGGVKWASLVGGSGEDNVQGLALDQNGNVFVTGLTASSDFPSGDQLYGPSDTYLAQLSPEGSLSQAVRVGGTGEELGRTVALDGAGRVVLCGLTSSGDFPVTSNASQTQYGGGEDAFIASFNATALASADQYFASFFGGGGDEACNGLASISGGNTIFAGITQSGAPQSFAKIGPGGGQDGTVALIAALPPGTAIIPSPTLPQATAVQTSPTPLVILTPTIPLVYTPPPATATPIATELLPTTEIGEGTAAQLPTVGGSGSAMSSASPMTESTAGPTETGESSSPETQTKSNTGWWIGGIAVVIMLAVGGWFYFRKK